MKALLILALSVVCQAFIMPINIKPYGDLPDCMISNCLDLLGKCEINFKCVKTAVCVEKCGLQPACEAACAQGMDNNQPFQNLMNCGTECLIESEEPGFACLSDQCITQWQACKDSKICTTALSCANTCFGVDSCMQDCASKAADQTFNDLLSCRAEYCSKGTLNKLDQ